MCLSKSLNILFPKMGVTQGQTGQSLRNVLYCVLIAPSFRLNLGSREVGEFAKELQQGPVTFLALQRPMLSLQR